MESIFEALVFVRTLYQNSDSDLLESLSLSITRARPIDRLIVYKFFEISHQNLSLRFDFEF